jgi:hypothetical protein
MAQVQATGYVFMVQEYGKDADGRRDYAAGKKWVPEIWPCKIDDNESRICIGEQTLTVETPDDFNPIPIQVAALEKEKREALELYQRTVAQINERLSKLLAISNEVEA